MKRLYLFFVLLLLVTACDSKSAERPVYYSSIDKAIEQGLLEEGITKEYILYKQEIEHGMIAFFVEPSNYAVSAATLTEQPEGWRWYRSMAFVGFDGESPLLYASARTVTEAGDEILLFLGRANDPEITQVQLKNKNTNEVEIIPLVSFDGEKFLFKILDKELSNYEVSEVRGK